MNEWNIQSRAHACGACGKPFAHQQAYHTLLFDEKSALQRMDVCHACWQNENTASLRDRQGFVSYWQGVYEAPPPVTEAIPRENAESLLRKLIEQADPRHAAAGYILAVMLERKRILKIKEQLVRDGQRVFIYEHARSGDVFTIADPDLKLDQLEQVQRDVAALLEHGPNPPPARATAGAPFDPPSEAPAQAEETAAAPSAADPAPAPALAESRN